MKGVILAGGTGSRLKALTRVTNKHLLPVGRYPMIYYPLTKLAQAGIRDILIVTGTDCAGDFVRLLGNGQRMGLSLTYRFQEEAGGIAHALALAKNFVRGEQLIVLLGDNIFSATLTPYVKAFVNQGEGARVLLKEVPDPLRYGVATLAGDRIVGIVEKPQHTESNLVVTGVYMYDSSIFDIIAHLQPSHRGELEVTDVNNAYLRRGQLTYDIMDGWWIDAGNFSALAQVCRQVEESGLAEQVQEVLGE